MATPINTPSTTPTSTAQPTQQKHSGRKSLSGSVLKIMGIFSGVEVITIICSIIRTKLVATLIGPAGMGLFGLYNSVIDTIGSVAQLGTGTGVIRALAVSPRKTLPKLVAVIRRWGLGLGLAGSLITLAISPWLSRFTFGDENHTWGFVALSIIILLLVLSNNEAAIFQGLKHYTRLAKSTVTGAVISIIVCIPMYYYWREASVIPSLITYALITWICRGLYREKVDKPTERISLKETLVTGKDFAMLGVYITLTTFASNAVAYIFMSYLNRTAGTETAGFYQAGFNLVNRYIGLILTAIGMEFLPRLSEVCSSRRRIGLYLSHEIIVLMLVVFPIITLFITCDELIVHLLYDKEFIVMTPFIIWAIIGTVLRAWSWCMAYIILAKNDGITFLVTETLSSLVAISLNIFMFNHFGIAGLGYAYLLWYTFYLAEVWAVAHWRYKIRIKPEAIILPTAILLVCIATTLVRTHIGWVGGLPFVALAIVVSAIGLKRLLGLSFAELAKKFVKPAKKG
jgi:PST family polysaccharide transporter